MAGKFIFSTQDTNKKTIKLSILVGIFFIVVGILCQDTITDLYNSLSPRADLYDYLDPRIKDFFNRPNAEALFTLLWITLLRVIPFGVALLNFIAANRYSKVYVDLYDDHIKGMGFSKRLIINSFHLKKDQISSISVENSTIIRIYANGASYRIPSGRASDFEYYYRTQFNK